LIWNSIKGGTFEIITISRYSFHISSPPKIHSHALNHDFPEYVRYQQWEFSFDKSRDNNAEWNMHTSYCFLEVLTATTDKSDCYITTKWLFVYFIHDKGFASGQNRNEHVYKICVLHCNTRYHFCDSSYWSTSEERRLNQDLYSATSQKTTFFTVTAVKPQILQKAPFFVTVCISVVSKSKWNSLALHAYISSIFKWTCE
jgi:hypothetical protein